MTTQTEFKSRNGGKSQCDKILARLESERGKFVPMPSLVECSGSYVIATRISDLRKRGHNIEQLNTWVNGECHSFYRLN